MNEKLKNVVGSILIGVAHFAFYWFVLTGLFSAPIVGAFLPITLSVVAAYVLYFLSRYSNGWLWIVRVTITLLPLLFTFITILLFSAFYK